MSIVPLKERGMEYKELVTVILALVIIYSVVLFYLVLAVNKLKSEVRKLRRQ